LAGFEQLSHMPPVHAHERYGAAAGERCRMSERALQEAGEGRDGHFAGAHGELAMADAAESGRMPVDWDVVGRIGEDEVSPFGPHQPIEYIVVSGVAAGQAMAVEPPNISWPGDSGGRITGRERDLVLGFRFGWTVRCSLSRLIEYEVNFGRRKTGELDVEVEGHEALQFDCQQLLVPARVQCELVVGQHIGSPLRLIEVSEAHRRHTFHADQLCGLDPPMARDDLAVLPDQHRVGKAEPADAVGDLPDLLFGMGAGIAGIGPKPPNRHRLDRHRLDGVRHQGLRGDGCWTPPLRSSRRARIAFRRGR
jgi:hypothetical protein